MWRNSKDCRWGVDCNRADCRFNHPTGRRRPSDRAQMHAQDGHAPHEPAHAGSFLPGQQQRPTGQQHGSLQLHTQRRQEAMLETAGQRECTQCKVVRSRSEYSKTQWIKGRDGRYGRCSYCTSVRSSGLPPEWAKEEVEPEPEPEPQADGVEALFAEFAREDAANAAAEQVGTADDSDDAIIGFIADSIVTFDDELEALRQGGPGALREHALQEALSDCQKNNRQLRLQELRLRRFCEQPGTSLDAPDKQLAECLGMLEQRRQQQQAKLHENEALEYKLLLSRRGAELAEALQRAEAAELALQVERESQSRAKIAATTAVENEQSSRVASVGADACANIAPSVGHPAVLPPACGQEDKSPRAIVDRLRMEKLVGGSSDPAIQSLQATLGRALEKLSRDLYSSTEHFFSEIVQNCDDNDYPEGVIPTLRVVHTPSAISIGNNEIGFAAADVAGLCNIGAGTKARDSVERVRIGRKGIGFKSVFMVTESPYICSAGFCWRFDTAAHGLFGYIVPEWVNRETLRAQLPESFDLPESDRHGTVIWLPLKVDEPGGKFMDVSVQVEPPALLFLRRLCDIQLEDRRGPLPITTRLSVETLSDGSSQMSVEAQRLCDGASDERISVKRLRQIVNGSEHETLDYILFTERLEIPAVVANQETDHCAGDVTQLVLAFPLVDEPEPQSIFAFLPVCPSNFPFVICADWGLTSSRQSVHSDSALNLWLRDHIAIVFGQAVACIPKIRENVGRYLPVEDMNSGVFWAPVATQLRTVLKDQACIFTEGGSWRKPQDVLLRAAECPPDLISNECLYTCCSKEFISESQLKSLGCEKATELGCRKFEFSDLTLCFQRTEFVDQLQEAPDSYFERLYHYLHAVVGLDDSDDLFVLPIFRIHEPSETGETLGSVLACLADGKIFSSIPETWHNVLYTRAVRVMCNAPSSVAAQQFCRSVDVLEATLVDVLDTIQDQHLAAAFNNRREVWSGLQFLKDYSQELDASESSSNQISEIKRRLQLSLCAPAYCGALMSVSDLSVPCFMGVSCSICFPDQTPSVPSELKPKLLPVHITPPISTNSMEVRTQIKRGSGAASIVTHLSSRDKHKSFDQAAIASEGTSRGKIRYDVTVLAEGVGVGFAAASACAESDSYLLNPSPRQGSIVMFGDGVAWLGSECAQGSQRFGPGDIVTVATDAKEGLIFLAVNGVLVDGPQMMHDTPAMPGRAHGAGLQVPREMIGGKLLPMIVLNGAECEVSFAADLHIQNLLDFVPLAAYQTSNIRSRCSNEELSIDLSHVPSNQEMLTAEKRLSWEAFFLSMGAAPHLATCSEPSFWNGHDGKCAICLSAFMPSDPAVEVATCQHRFHGSCIQEWLSRKQTCPVCRGTAKPAELQQPALRKGPFELSRSVEETLGRVTLMTPTSPGRKLLLQALHTYSSLSLTADILASTSVPTTHGLTSLDEVFVDSTYSRFAGPHLPYLSVSRAIPPDLASVLAALGVASVLDTRGVLKAIVLLGQLCRTNEGPEENGRLDLFAGLYGVLDGILRDDCGRDARIAAVRKCFRESAIIFANRSVLCRSDEALWEANYEIAAWLRRPVIGHLYPSLRLFFEDVLQVKSLGIEHCIYALRCMSRHEFRIAQLGNCSLLVAARVALAEVDKLLLHARDQGVKEHGGLDTCLANFPVLSDGTQLTDHAQPNYAIRCCEDCICLVRDGCSIDAKFMRETAPNVVAELLQRRMIYSLESAYVLQQEIMEPEDYPILDSACKDYLNLRYGDTDMRTPAKSSHIRTAIYRRQQSDPWASQSSMPTCTDRQTEAWSAAGHARSMIAQLKVRRCKRISCKFEFLPAAMELGCEKHRRLRPLVHMSKTKGLGYSVEVPFGSTCMDQHCYAGQQLILTAVDRELAAASCAWVENGELDWSIYNEGGPSGLSYGLQNYAQGLAVFGRILEEQYAIVSGTALQHDPSRFQGEVDLALQYLRQRMESLLKEDVSSAEEEEADQEAPGDQRELTAEVPDEQVFAPNMQNDTSEPTEPTAPNRLDDAAQQALLLDAAISSTLAPWDLPRTRPTGGPPEHAAAALAEEDHPALRSQSAMEAAAYGYLEHHLPGFGSSNWRSEHRETFLGSLPEFAASMNTNTTGGLFSQGQSGFAFEYDDRQGLLSSDGTPRRLLIGVKGNASRPFELTAAEHAVMQSYTQGGSRTGSRADGLDSGSGRAPEGASGFLSGIDILPTEFVLLHLEASGSQDGSGPTKVKVSHAIHDPHQAGLTVEPAMFFAHW